MRLALVVAACGLAVAGCARDAGQVGATYESPNSYQDYTCPQLAEEAAEISSRVAQATGQDFTGDRIAADLGRIVFFPILVFGKGNYVHPKELTRLKRSLEAIEQASIQKNCGITFHHA
jgi:hypothetical protein